MARFTLILLLTALLAGCWNGGNTHVRMGDVSIGQQLIDLQSAQAKGALSEQEYQDTKRTLLRLNELCANPETDTGIEWF